MKKIFTIIGAALFVLSFGIAYAGTGLNNGVTDFTGKTYDVLEMASAVGAGDIHEGSAAGGVRPAESETVKPHNGITDFSGKTHDTIENSQVPCVCKTEKGSATGGPRRDITDKESRIRSDDRSWVDTDHN